MQQCWRNVDVKQSSVSSARQLSLLRPSRYVSVQLWLLHYISLCLCSTLFYITSCYISVQLSFISCYISVPLPTSLSLSLRLSLSQLSTQLFYIISLNISVQLCFTLYQATSLFNPIHFCSSCCAYLIFVISFTQAEFFISKFYAQKLTKNTPKYSKISLKSKIYAIFVFNLENFPPVRIFLHGHRPWCP